MEKRSPLGREDADRASPRRRRGDLVWNSTVRPPEQPCRRRDGDGPRPGVTLPEAPRVPGSEAASRFRHPHPASCVRLSGPANTVRRGVLLRGGAGSECFTSSKLGFGPWSHVRRTPHKTLRDVRPGVLTCTTVHARVRTRQGAWTA